MEHNVNQTISILRALEVNLEGHFISGDNVMLRCPFAPISGHKHTVDRRPSFGVRLTDEGLHYNCFTCGRSGKSLRTLVNSLRMEGLVDSSIDVYKVMNNIRVHFPKFYNILKAKDGEQNFDRKGELEFTEKFRSYHKNRGVSLEAIDKFMIRYSKRDSAIIFPLYDIEGNYKGFVEKRIHEYKTSYINHASIKNVLYGESLVKTNHIIVVEGMYDVIRVYQFLHNMNLLVKYSVVGAIGANITEEQILKLSQFAKVIYLMGDNDYAGRKMEKTIYYGIRKLVPLVMKINYKTKDPAMLSANSFRRALNCISFFAK